MRVLVCGGRDYDDRDAVFCWLDQNTPRTDPDKHGNDMPAGVTVIHGACRTGADRWADEWAVVNWCLIEEYPAQWDAFGRRAGPIRNQRMLDEGKPDLVVAFPGGRGTEDIVRRAKAAGVPVRMTPHPYTHLPWIIQATSPSLVGFTPAHNRDDRRVASIPDDVGLVPPATSSSEASAIPGRAQDRGDYQGSPGS